MIIRFKKADETLLKSLFPYVPKAEYELIMGMEMPVADSVINKARSDGYFSYHKVNIPMALIEENPLGDEEVDFGDNYLQLIIDLSNKFIHSKIVVDSLYPGMMLNKNVLLYGKGGHGKSEMTEQFFKKAHQLGLIKEPPFVQALGEGLTEEAIFGGLEMKTLIDTGKYVYLVENSFMNHEIVIFEELFDAPPAILLSLKDILTSGYFRKGNQMFKIKTKMVVGLTNKSKDDFSEDESLEAFAQRFGITTKVEWETYSRQDFNNLFAKVFNKDSEYYKEHKTKFNELANIIELNNSIGSTFVSPRTAVSSAELYAFGSSLSLISDIDQEIVTKYFQENKDAVLIDKSSKIITAADKYLAGVVESCKSIDSNDSTDEILDMLSGGTTNFGMSKVLSESDNKVVKVSINRLTWLETHLNNSNIHVTVVQDRVSLMKSIEEFKLKLIKIKQ